MTQKTEQSRSPSEPYSSPHAQVPERHASGPNTPFQHPEPYFNDKTSPCNMGCPAGEDIVEAIYLTAEGRFQEAWELILQENPFPGVCGRVCPHPCESECNRRELDGAICIHAVERFLADYGRSIPRSRPKSRPQRSKQVAIVGSGPAGLSCAYHLALMGYGATVFEALPKAGGMLRVGIPRYRLPRAVLDQEIADIRALGVEIRTNTLVGRDITLDQLRGFDALFIATGFHRGQKMDVPGEEARGVFSGLEILKRVSLGEKIRIGEQVAVIGGGNTAVHVARCLLRLGCRPTILYRRSRGEMTAIDKEINGAQEEGIEIICLAALTQILVRGGWAKGVEFVKMRLSRPDESGRRRQVPKKGSNFWLKVDGVVSAIEELADIEFLPDDIKSESQGILVERGCFTSRKGVFAGGDVATGRATVAHAIGSGNKAALAIERYLKGEDFFSIPESLGTDQILPRKADSGVVRFNDLNPVYFKKELPVPLRARPVKTRVKGFKEVYSGYKAEEIVTEAQRCFSCGVCNMCDNCLIFCPCIAISRRRGKFGYKIDVTSCDGCGICVQECPRDALSFRKVP